MPATISLVFSFVCGDDAVLSQNGKPFSVTGNPTAELQPQLALIANQLGMKILAHGKPIVTPEDNWLIIVPVRLAPNEDGSLPQVMVDDQVLTWEPLPAGWKDLM